MEDNIGSIWETLRQIDEEAFFDPLDLDGHYSKHKSKIDVESDEEYNELTHELTSSPAAYIQGDLEKTVQGYVTQNGIKVKFKKYKNTYILSAYSGDAVDGRAVTCYLKNLKNILQDADPYRFYKRGIKDADYRYRCDLDGRFQGLRFFNEHAEYHKDTPPEKIKEIKRRLYKRERLRTFNTDKEKK